MVIKEISWVWLAYYLKLEGKYQIFSDIKVWQKIYLIFLLYKNEEKIFNEQNQEHINLFINKKIK